MSLESVRDVITVLGGLDAAASLAGVSYKTASAWQTRLRKMPPDTYLLFSGELERRGHKAPPSLWGMKVRRVPKRNPRGRP